MNFLNFFFFFFTSDDDIKGEINNNLHLKLEIIRIKNILINELLLIFFEHPNIYILLNIEKSCKY